MRWRRFILSVCAWAALAGLPAFAGVNEIVDPPVISCGNGIPGGVNCVTSRKDLKEARNAYSHGLKLEQRSLLPEAFAAFDEASRLAPMSERDLATRASPKTAAASA